MLESKGQGANVHFMWATAAYLTFEHLFKLCDIAREYGAFRKDLRTLFHGRPRHRPRLVFVVGREAEDGRTIAPAA